MLEEREEVVVLLDAAGLDAGAAAKATVHSSATPLHLGFSCYVVRPDGKVLLTRRAATKPTWPSTWTNACCGHPAPGEHLRTAVDRRLRAELDLVATRMAIILPDFTYRAVMEDGTVEHEVCPVVVAEVDREPRLNPDEAEAASWMSWTALLERAQDAPDTLSPWSLEQIRSIGAVTSSPRTWLASAPPELLLDAHVAPGVRTRTAISEHVDPLACVRDRIRPLLFEFVRERQAELLEIDPALAPVTREIRNLVEAGGKGLRPAFVHWGHRTSVLDDEAVDPAAAAVELLHVFALLHDDVMDRSELRRGRAAAHRALAREHRRAAFRGDPDWFGASAAILAGDLTFVWADELFDRATVDPAAAARGRRAFSRLRAEVMAGQYLDLRLAALPYADEDAARRVALLKSGRYTVTRPLQIGVALASGEPDRERDAALEAYGDAVGLAFQLRDDVLGLFGEPSETGKQAFEDLREGKRTLLVLRALHLAAPEERRFLRAALGDSSLDEAGAARCRDIVASSGALASIETLLRALHDRARRALAAIPSPAHEALEALAALAIERYR
jgi:isopentenyl-diphosphate delta-isomerase type 1